MDDFVCSKPIPEPFPSLIDNIDCVVPTTTTTTSTATTSIDTGTGASATTDLNSAFPQKSTQMVAMTVIDNEEELVDYYEDEDIL